MNISQMTGLPIPKTFGFLIAGWLALEIAAFIFVSHSIGVFLALLLAIGTSLIGLADSRKLLDYLRRRALGAKLGAIDAQAEGALFDGALQALAVLLLILPGFASDFIGLALKSPSMRKSLAKRLSAKAVDPRHIDLPPSEWKRLATRRAAGKKAPRRGAMPPG